MHRQSCFRRPRQSCSSNHKCYRPLCLRRKLNNPTNQSRVGQSPPNHCGQRNHAILVTKPRLAAPWHPKTALVGVRLMFVSTCQSDRRYPNSSLTTTCKTRLACRVDRSADCWNEMLPLLVSLNKPRETRESRRLVVEPLSLFSSVPVVLLRTGRNSGAVRSLPGSPCPASSR